MFGTVRQRNKFNVQVFGRINDDLSAKVRKNPDMTFQYVSEHREYLQREYLARARRRPLYSQRAFARDIGLSPSALTDYFKGRIRLSSGRIALVGKTIGLTSEQRQHWVDLLDMKYSKTTEVKKLSELRVKARIQSQSHSISVDQFKVISEWFHMAYLELIQLNAAKYSDIKAAALALDIPVRALRVAVKRLEAVKLLAKDESGNFVVKAWTVLGDSIPSLAVRQFHAQMLKKAVTALEEQPMDRRFVSTTMVALPKVEVERILENIKTLAVRYLEPYSQAPAADKDSLYCLSLQFYDLLSRKETSV